MCNTSSSTHRHTRKTIRVPVKVCSAWRPLELRRSYSKASKCMARARDIRCCASAGGDRAASRRETTRVERSVHTQVSREVCEYHSLRSSPFRENIATKVGVPVTSCIMRTSLRSEDRDHSSSFSAHPYLAQCLVVFAPDAALTRTGGIGRRFGVHVSVPFCSATGESFVDV